MKKSIVAGAGVAAFAFAAFPLAGVFADPVTSTQDTLTLTVSKGCNLSTSRSDTVAAFGSLAPGNTSTDGTSPFTVTCNAAWELTPTVTSDLASGANVISPSATLDGTVSGWGLKLTVGEGPTNDFSNFAVVNGSNKVSSTSAADAVSVTPSYKVSVAPGQATGTYNGTVTYNVTTTNP